MMAASVLLALLAGGSVWSNVLAVAATLVVLWWVGRAARRALRQEVGDGGEAA